MKGHEKATVISPGPRQFPSREPPGLSVHVAPASFKLRSNILLPGFSTMKSMFGGGWWGWDLTLLQSTIVTPSILEIQTGSESPQATELPVSAGVRTWRCTLPKVNSLPANEA